VANPATPQTKSEDAAKVVKRRTGRARRMEAPTKAVVKRDAARMASTVAVTNEVMKIVSAKAKKLRSGIPLKANWTATKAWCRFVS
jgi:hypothetical protein